jgi:YYY domain-containing protein
MKLPFASRAEGKALAPAAASPFAGRLSWAILDSKLATAVILGVILLVGLQLRVSQVNWDRGQHLHPDERFLSIITSQIRAPESIGQYFNSEESPLNPYRESNTFVYGTVPLFINKAVSEWLDRDADGTTHWTADVFRDVARPFGVDMEHDDGVFTFNGGYDSNQVGRVLSALADVLTIALIFELGRVLYGRRAGLLAAGLLSLTVLHIQYAHFFGSETYLALFTTAVVYFAARILKYGSGWNYVFAGLFYGLALATKLSAVPVLGIVGLAVLLRLLPQLTALSRATSWRGPAEIAAWRTLLTHGAWCLALALVAGLTFRIGQPYAFDSTGFLDVFDFKLSLPGDLLSTAVLDPRNYFSISEKFSRDIENLRGLQQGSDFPPNLQWIGRPLLWFPLRNIILWGMGVPLAAAALTSLIYAARRGVSQRDFGSLLLAVWVVGYFLFAGRGFVPTMRYFIPIYPVLVLLAAFGLMQAWDFAASGRAGAALPARIGRLRPLAKPLLQGAVAAAILGTALWALAFTGIYRQDISRVQASYWIAQNVPPGSKLSFQEWDDGVPLNLPGIELNRWQHVTLKPYLPDSPEKVRELVAGLDQVDYVVETSNRLYDSIPRNAARYPSTVLYYRYLFDGTLGFEKVAEFTNYPRLFGIDIPDQSAEEAFTVYDHPKVTIWRKTDAYSHDRALALLNPDLASRSVNLIPADAARNALLLRPDDQRAQQQGGTWSDVFADSGLAASNPTLLWLLALELSALAAAPLAMLLFHRLPDRGYLLSKPLGMLLLGYPVWLIVSAGLVHFTQATVLGVLTLLVTLAAGVSYRWREELSAFVRQHWRLILFCEVLFLLAFFGFREIRMLNPDLWHPARGGEKPMDLTYLTAVARSTTLPPYDAWFADGYINYYYLGQFFTATLVKLTRIPPEIAFNLAVPTFFALTVAASFSVAFNLAAAGRAMIRRAAGRRPIPAWSPYAAGLLGAFLVAVAGNLDGVGQLTQRLSAVSSFHAGSGLPVLDSVVNSAGGMWQVLAHGAELQQFDYWRSSRMMPPAISITEFPYFSFMFADLHAHMMAIAFQVLAIGIGLALVLGQRGERGSGREWAIVALLGLVVGSLRWVNSWDYPPFLLLALAALAISERRLEGGPAWTLSRLAARALLLVAVSFLAYLPFLHNYQTPVSGVIAAPETTKLHQYLAHFGVFAAIAGAWLLFLLLRSARGSRACHSLFDARLRKKHPEDIASLAFAAAVLFFLASLGVFLFDRGNGFVALLLPALALVAYLAVVEVLRPKPDAGIRLFVLALLGLGLGLSAGVDLVTLQGDIVRMNTVFKFYLHIWVVFALAAAYAAWQLLFVVWQVSLSPPARPLPKALATGGLAGLGLLLAGAVIYPVLATPARIDDRFASLPRTLDGAAYMRTAVYNDEKGDIALSYDYEGIQWMRENVQGTPIILEGRTPLYRWGGRFAVYTGLPAVLGWDWHQVQQRGPYGYMVGERAIEIDRFYGEYGSGEALAFLRKYRVSYVILGRVERLYYAQSGLNKFRDGLGGVLEVAFQNEQLTIYQVNQARLFPGLSQLP